MFQATDASVVPVPTRKRRQNERTERIKVQVIIVVHYFPDSGWEQNLSSPPSPSFYRIQQPTGNETWRLAFLMWLPKPLPENMVKNTNSQSSSKQQQKGDGRELQNLLIRKRQQKASCVCVFAPYMFPESRDRFSIVQFLYQNVFHVRHVFHVLQFSFLHFKPTLYSCTAHLQRFRSLLTCYYLMKTHDRPSSSSSHLLFLFPPGSRWRLQKLRQRAGDRWNVWMLLAAAFFAVARRFLFFYLLFWRNRISSGSSQIPRSLESHRRNAQQRNPLEKHWLH